MYLRYLCNTIHANMWCARVLVLSLLVSSVLPMSAYAQVAGENDGGAATGTVAVVVDENQEEQGDDEDFTIIETGDADADVSVQTEINTNNNQTEVSTTTDNDVDSVSASTTDEEVDENEYQESNDASEEANFVIPAPKGEADIQATSSATSTVEIEADATSGDNKGNDNENTVIVTGDADASASAVTVANTNIINSEGFVMLLDSLGDYMDLRDLTFWENVQEQANEEQTDPCEVDSCTPYVFVESDQHTSITNTIDVNALSGGNETSNNDGVGAIISGDAHASVNVVNVANTNFIDSNYLILTANNFGTLGGDILLPSSEDLLQTFFGGVGTSHVPQIQTDNTVAINDTIDANAISGDNNVNGSDTGSIYTGDSDSSINVVNRVNENYYNTDSFMFVIRVHGSWGGSVLGLPDELVWNGDFDGGVITNASTYGSEGSSEYDSQRVDATNTVDITNTISAQAVSGDNTAENNDYSYIESGNAYAGVNVVNVANTNVIGRNWLLAVINIFGDWSGSVSFGQADLWIGGQVDTKGKDELETGDWYTMHYTVVNNSDTIAPDVTIVEDTDEHLRFRESETGGELRGGSVVWEVGDLGPGESVEVEYSGTVRPLLPWAYSTFENHASVSADISDANYVDNTEVVRFTGYRHPHTFLSEGPSEQAVSSDAITDENEPFTGGSGSGYTLTADPIITVTKTNFADGPVQASSTVQYQTTIKNEGGEAYYAVLYDVIKDAYGEVLYKQFWPLETIYPGEEIVIDYSVFFNADTEPGIYVNYAHVEAVTGYPSIDPLIGEHYQSPVATSPVVVTAIEVRDDSVVVPTATVSRDDQTIFPTGSETLRTRTPLLSEEEEVVMTEDARHLTSMLGALSIFDKNIGEFLLRSETDPSQGRGDRDPIGQAALALQSLLSHPALPYSWLFLLVLLLLALALKRSDRNAYM
jgi:hypothetical protein